MFFRCSHTFSLLFCLSISLTLLAACNQSEPGNPPGLGEPPPGLGESPPVVYVNVKATGSGNGSSWADAYTDLETAVENASEGQLWVAQGSYDLSDSLALISGVAIYGGFAGNETSLSARDWEDNATTVDGSNVSGPVVTSGDVDATAVLDGFTIQNGEGGLSNSGGSPTLNNLVFSNNAAVNGGGMYNQGGNPTLSNVTFTGNDARNGGGFYNAGGSPTLTDVFFGSRALNLEGNKANINGGGLYIAGGNPSLTRVTFYNNTAAGLGGGLYIATGSPTLNGVDFDTNTSLKGGGGLYNVGGSLTMTSGSFSNNSVGTGSSGGGVYNGSGSINLQDTTLGDNKAQLNGGGLYNQSGNVSLSESFQFQNNTAAKDGGGLYSAGGSLTLDTGGFSTNKATGQGGGLYLTEGDAVKITNIDLSENESLADSGGGMYLAGGGALTLNAVKFGGNTAQLDGGGLYASGDGTLTLAAVSFTNNTATNGSGGGMYNSGNALVTQGSGKSTFSTNTAGNVNTSTETSGMGGGLYHENADATLTNVSFGANTATNAGGGMYAKGEETVTLEAVTVLNNRAAQGGGLYNSGNTLHIQGSVQSQFTSNIVSTKDLNLGGGLYHENADASLTNVLFSSNKSDTRGGGAYVTDAGQLTMENVNFMENTGGDQGGGLDVADSSVRFDHGSFTGNQASSGGGMILECSSDQATATLSNLIFVKNTADVGGGVSNGCQSILVNVTMSGNQASSSGGGLFLYTFQTDVGYIVLNSVLWGNQDSSSSLQNGQIATGNGTVSTLIFKNNLIQGDFDPRSYAGQSDVENTLTADPLFVCSPGGSCGTTNLQLQSSSPAINNGNNNVVPNGVTTDITGNPRISDSIVDLGAYEFQGSPTLTPPTTSPTIDPGRYAQCAGTTGKWASGYQVRYAASFVGTDGSETNRGPRTEWTNGSPYMLPNLQDVPIDPSGRAAARKVYRQFLADYVSSNPSAGITLTGTLNDNNTTQLQDEDAAGTPVVPCPN